MLKKAKCFLRSFGFGLAVLYAAEFSHWALTKPGKRVFRHPIRRAKE